jgi:hypothetical protein
MNVCVVHVEVYTDRKKTIHVAGFNEKKKLERKFSSKVESSLTFFKKNQGCYKRGKKYITQEKCEEAGCQEK